MKRPNTYLKSLLGNLAFEAILSIIGLSKARKYDLCHSIIACPAPEGSGSVFATPHKQISGEMSPIVKFPTSSYIPRASSETEICHKKELASHDSDERKLA